MGQTLDLHQPSTALRRSQKQSSRVTSSSVFATGACECSPEKSHIMQTPVGPPANSPAGDGMENANASLNSSQPGHRVGILMAQTGRFLECIMCRLSFTFPPGSHYETIAKQFESHHCQPAVNVNPKFL
jgi:hypothetical protein